MWGLPNSQGSERALNASMNITDHVSLKLEGILNNQSSALPWVANVACGKSQAYFNAGALSGNYMLSSCSIELCAIRAVPTWCRISLPSARQIGGCSGAYQVMRGNLAGVGRAGAISMGTGMDVLRRRHTFHEKGQGDMVGSDFAMLDCWRC